MGWFSQSLLRVFPLFPCVSSAGGCDRCPPCPLMISGSLFFKQSSIISLFETPVGEEASVFAAISGEHIRDSAGLTVADKSCMINTLARPRARMCTPAHTRLSRLAAGGGLLLGEQQTSG